MRRPVHITFRHCAMALFTLLSVLLSVNFTWAYDGEYDLETIPSMRPPLPGTMDSLPITTEFGINDDGIHTGRGHAGLDFGVPLGTPILAAANGTIVDFEDGWPYVDDPDNDTSSTGFGNYVVILTYIDGEPVWHTYGHLDQGSVDAQRFSLHQIVKEGQQIGAVGSSGRSTGPHLHFQTDIGSQWGTHVNPHVYLGGKGGVTSGSYGKDGSSWSFDLEQASDFGKVMREQSNVIVDACLKGMKILKEKMFLLFSMLITIDLVWGAIWAMMKTAYNPNTGQPANFQGFIYWFIKRLIFYGVLIAFFRHWQDWYTNFVLTFFTETGSLVSGQSTADIGAMVSDPSLIVEKGLHILSPVFSHIGSFTVIGMVFNGVTLIICLILAFVALIGFMLIAIEIDLAYLEFYLVALFGFTMFCFCGEEHLRRQGTHSINAVFTSGVKLFFYCVFTVIFCSILSTVTAKNLFADPETQTTQEEQNKTDYKNGQHISIDQFMAAIRAQESEGSGGYMADNGDHYGAYQIAYVNWESWCKEAKAAGEAVDMTPAKEPPTPGAPIWTPGNQDTVARYVMLQYYNKYHSWDMVAREWHCGEGGIGDPAGEWYSGKIQARLSKPIPSRIRIVVLLEIIAVELLFILFSGTATRTIIENFGSGQGFVFYTFQGDHDRFL